MKKFFEEFKKFITRGNVMDMAVGVIIGGAFSAIVTALTNHILMPIVNWFLLLITGGNGLDSIYTYLNKVEVFDIESGKMVVDTANSIYIDWGAFVTAVINFLLIAFVLFMIVKTINKVAEANKKIKEDVKEGKLTKADKIELKSQGVDIKDKAAVSAYFAEKKIKEQAALDAAAKEAEEKAKAERLANPTAEDLLKDIKELLIKQAK
ncbi:MAG: large conductance mechanosensitive channel protein MscL [Clostridia bacterium]|nr:large conductance mechanosensitive channel protein MscL [Clostridia bacterium]